VRLPLNRRRDNDTSVQAIIDRIDAERHADCECREDFRRPMDISKAHRTMQEHKDCRVDECQRKRQARRTLIEAGRLKPDGSRTR